MSKFITMSEEEYESLKAKEKFAEDGLAQLKLTLAEYKKNGLQKVL